MCYNTQGPFSVKFNAAANELGQGRTQLRYYKDILLEITIKAIKLK